jgi:hypothetical protein
MEYKINLSTAENLALGYVAFSQQEWINNSVHERCRIAIEEIVKICVEKCLENNIQIPGSKDAMVELAFEKEWVKTAEQQSLENLNSTRPQE